MGCFLGEFGGWILVLWVARSQWWLRLVYAPAKATRARLQVQADGESLCHEIVKNIRQVLDS